MDAFLGVLFMVALFFGMMLAYKNRVAVAKWLNDPTMAASQDPKMRRRYLQRRIEDAQFELEKLDEIEKK
jgi:hypothetical protein